MATIKTAVTDQEIRMCWEALFLLRPMLDPQNFVNKIKDMQKEGYTLLYLFEDNKVVAIAGYRILTMLHCDKIVYIDDLSTLATFRDKGHATSLLNKIYEIAQKNNCAAVHLDSEPLRTEAHKLYLKEGFTVTASHFSKKTPNS